MFKSIKFLNRLSYLIGGFSLIILIFSLIYYNIENGFRVKEIIIKGEINHITPIELSYIAKNKLKGTFFTLDINELQREFRHIPWVKNITVERIFPNTIVVNIIEYIAIAKLKDNSLLSKEGKIFSGIDKSLPTFIIDKSQIGVILKLYSFLEPILKLRNWQLSQLSYGQGIEKISLTNGLNIVACGINSSKDLQKLSFYLDQIYKLQPNLNYINMCYKNALAINTLSTKG